MQQYPFPRPVRSESMSLTNYYLLTWLATCFALLNVTLPSDALNYWNMEGPGERQFNKMAKAAYRTDIICTQQH